MAGIDVFAGDLGGEVDWDFANLTGGLELSSLTSIRGDYGHLCEVCLVVS